MKLWGFPVSLCSPTRNVLNHSHFDISLILVCSFNEQTLKDDNTTKNFHTVTSSTFSSHITPCILYCFLAYASHCKFMSAHEGKPHWGWRSLPVWTEGKCPVDHFGICYLLKISWAGNEDLGLNILLKFPQKPYDRSPVTCL